ncbi:MAG: replication protein P [Candidatus Tenebribacter davisii]|nr:replication protein P [Candidatus Tenebribacter davisii]
MTKHISDFINKSDPIKGAGETKNSNLCPMSTKVVNSLFKYFFGVCRGFEKQYSDANKLSFEKTQWIIAFSDLGLTDIKQCEAGIKNTRLESPIYTPRLKEFLQWNEDFSFSGEYPRLEDAYDQACRNSHPCQTEKEWSHPSVRHAWAATGAWRMRIEPRKSTLPEFSKNYKHATKLHKQGNLHDSIEKPESKNNTSRHDNEHEKYSHIKGRDAAISEIKKILGRNF